MDKREQKVASTIKCMKCHNDLWKDGKCTECGADIKEDSYIGDFNIYSELKKIVDGCYNK